MSNFRDVYSLNETFKVPQTNIKEQDFSVLEPQLALIEEEFDELKEAIANKDWEQVKDAVGDILVVTYGMGYRGSFDCDKLMENISSSNFSKLCNDSDQVAETQAYYTSLGVETFVEETKLADKVVYAVKSLKDQSYVEHGKEKSIRAGKFLKNTVWHEPNLAVDGIDNK